MEGSCEYEYIELAVVDSRQGAVLQLEGWAGATDSSLEEPACYETSIRGIGLLLLLRIIIIIIIIIMWTGHYHA